MTKILKGSQKFYIGEDEANPIAQLTYKEVDQDTIEADHTFVSETLRGQGIANELFKEFMAFVEKENKKVIPTCSYVKLRMERSKQYRPYIREE